MLLYLLAGGNPDYSTCRLILVLWNYSFCQRFFHTFRVGIKLNLCYITNVMIMGICSNINPFLSSDFSLVLGCVPSGGDHVLTSNTLIFEAVFLSLDGEIVYSGLIISVYKALEY